MIRATAGAAIVRLSRRLGGLTTCRIFTYYHESEAVVGIEPIELLAGSIQRRQGRLVEAWANSSRPSCG